MSIPLLLSVLAFGLCRDGFDIGRLVNGDYKWYGAHSASAPCRLAAKVIWGPDARSIASNIESLLRWAASLRSWADASNVDSMNITACAGLLPKPDHPDLLAVRRGKEGLEKALSQREQGLELAEQTVALNLTLGLLRAEASVPGLDGFRESCEGFLKGSGRQLGWLDGAPPAEAWPYTRKVVEALYDPGAEAPLWRPGALARLHAVYGGPDTAPLGGGVAGGGGERTCDEH